VPPATIAKQYHSASIALHWLMLLLIVVAYATMELRGYAPRGAARDFVKMIHYSVGLSIFALVLFRLALRFATPTPPIDPPLTLLHRIAAWSAVVALYAFMIAMPLLGWIALSADGKPVVFFGIPLFAIAGPDKNLAHYMEDIHGTIANIGYGLIGLHAAAALYHHYLRRDNTLLRMAPFWRR
jgi:cytochrome b561